LKVVVCLSQRVKRKTENNEFLLKKKEKKKERKKREKKEKKKRIVFSTPKGVWAATIFGWCNWCSSIHFLHLVSTPLFSFTFSNLDLCSWIIIQFCITTFQRIPLTYYPTKLHLQAP